MLTGAGRTNILSIRIKPEGTYTEGRGNRQCLESTGDEVISRVISSHRLDVFARDLTVESCVGLFQRSRTPQALNANSRRCGSATWALGGRRV